MELEFQEKQITFGKFFKLKGNFLSLFLASNQGEIQIY